MSKMQSNQLEDEHEEEQPDNMCRSCNGTGEGSTPDTSCAWCKGKGAITPKNFNDE